MIERSAVISDCGRYRYLLRRVWDHGLLPSPHVLFVMLNPSTADGNIDDPTIRSCIRLSIELGFGGLEVVNLMAWRATEPKDIPNKPSLAMGAGNPRAIDEASSRCPTVICAWGAHPYAAHFAGGAVDIIRLNRWPIFCFGKTQSGAPRHPLFVKSGTPLIIFGG